MAPNEVSIFLNFANMTLTFHSIGDFVYREAFLHDSVCFGAMLTPIGFNTYSIGVHGHWGFRPVEVPLKYLRKWRILLELACQESVCNIDLTAPIL